MSIDWGGGLIVALTLGLRPGEVSALTWESIDFDAGTVTVYQSLSWPGTTTLAETDQDREYADSRSSLDGR